jgi:hypothetical protein
LHVPRTRSAATFAAANFAAGGIIAAILVIAVLAVAWPFPQTDISPLEEALGKETVRIEELRLVLDAAKDDVKHLATLAEQTREASERTARAVENQVEAAHLSEENVARRVVTLIAEPPFKSEIAKAIASQLAEFERLRGPE